MKRRRYGQRDNVSTISVLKTFGKHEAGITSLCLLSLRTKMNSSIKHRLKEGTMRGANKKLLMRSNYWRSIRCKTCKKSSSARTWRCSCKILWHSCSVHLRACCQGSNARVQPIKLVRKRSSQPPVIAMYSRNFKGASKEHKPVDKPKVKLGPKLAVRFPQIAA